MTSREEIIELLKTGDNYIIGCHLHPDGDAIGSLLALGLALETAGKKMEMVVPGGVPAMFRFIGGTEKIIEAPTFSPEVIISVDCAEKSRLLLPPETFVAGVPVVNIDHHVSNSMFGDFNYVQPEAAATGEIIYYILTAGGFALDTRAAEALYTAVATDTGFFRFSNTNDRVLSLVAGLVKTYNLSPGHIAEQVHEEKSYDSLRLLGEVLSTLRIAKNKKIAWMVLEHELLTKHSVPLEETENFVNHAISIQGVEVGLFFKEVNPGEIKVSWRSRIAVDVSRLAARFGGGGHARAAGCTINAPLSQAVAEVFSVLNGCFTENAVKEERQRV